MPEYKVINTTQLNDDLASIADAIRAKTGSSGSLMFPSGFINDIKNIVTSDRHITDTTTEPANNLPGPTGEDWTITTWSDGSIEAELITDLRLMYFGYYDDAPPMYGYGTYDSYPYVARLFPTGFSTSDAIEVTFVDSSDGRSVTPFYAVDNQYNCISFYGGHMVQSIDPPSEGEELTVTLKVKILGTGGIEKDDAVAILTDTLSEYENDKLTSVRPGAFGQLKNLKSVKLPNLESISLYCFADCSSLSSVTVNALTKVEAGAFAACTSLKSIDIPDSVISIGEYAFYQCYNLTDVTIPNKVIHISDYVFSDCSKLSSINIHDNVTLTGKCCFRRCTSLKDVVLGSRVRWIEDSAFYECTGLENITFNSDLWAIKDCAFYNCYNLKNIAIPDKVKSIGVEAFYGCSSIETAVIGNGVTTVGYNAFRNCGALANLTIGNKVTSIGEYAFSDCYALTSVILPDSLESISNGMFAGCKNLTHMTIGSGVTSIGEWAFTSCKNLKSITFNGTKAQWNAITKDANWKSTSSICAVYCTDGEISWHTFDETTRVCSRCSRSEIMITVETRYKFGYTDTITDLIIPETIEIDDVAYMPTYIDWHAFMGSSNLINVTIPNGVHSIGGYAFNGCTGLENITIPNSVTAIGEFAFYECTSLKNIAIPIGVTSIDKYAFSNCSSLTSVVIPDNIKSISEGLFSGCKNITSITIPNNVASIGEYAFNGCSSLTSITFKGTKAEWNTISKGTGWNWGTGNYTIHCTDGDITK